MDASERETEQPKGGNGKEHLLYAIQFLAVEWMKKQHQHQQCSVRNRWIWWNKRDWLCAACIPFYLRNIVVLHATCVRICECACKLMMHFLSISKFLIIFTWFGTYCMCLYVAFVPVSVWMCVELHSGHFSFQPFNWRFILVTLFTIYWSTFELDVCITNACVCVCCYFIRFVFVSICSSVFWVAVVVVVVSNVYAAKCKRFILSLSLRSFQNLICAPLYIVIWISAILSPF